MDAKISENTKILLITQIPVEKALDSILSEFSKYGKITDSLFLSQKRQAFIEFEQIENAQKCLSEYKGSLQIYKSQKSQIVHKEQGIANKILYITFEKVNFPLTADLLYINFSEYGNVQKVLIYNSTDSNNENKFNAMVEMDSIESAKKIKENLNNKSLFTGANFMNISYSKLQTLEIKSQNEKCRDYSALGFSNSSNAEEEKIMPKISPTQTVHEMLEELKLKIDKIGIPQEPKLYDPFNFNENQEFPIKKHSPELLKSMDKSENTPVLFIKNLPDDIAADKVFTLFACFGNVDFIKMLDTQKNTAFVQMASKKEANFARLHLDGCSFYGKEIIVEQAKIKSVYSGKGTFEYKGSKLNRYYKPNSKNTQNIAVFYKILLKNRV